MAEAAVEDPHRFFCHKCSREVRNLLPDFTCPNCCSGFIEELESQPPSNDVGDDSEEDVDSPVFQLYGDVLLMGLRDDQRLGSRNERYRGGRGSRDGDRRAGRANTRNQAFEDFMHLLTNISTGGGQGNTGTGRIAGRVAGFELFLGNPGDYAWGREGVDAIVTHLLNQMETTGPPPLSKEEIDDIPVTVISQDQVDKALQCSVCWENFTFEEPVRKLICTHVYHEGCIIPWLELHGTCPVCRKPQSAENEDPNSRDQSGTRGESLLASDMSTALNGSNSSGIRSRNNIGNTIQSLMQSNPESTTEMGGSANHEANQPNTNPNSSNRSGFSRLSRPDVPNASFAGLPNIEEMDLD